MNIRPISFLAVAAAGCFALAACSSSSSTTSAPAASATSSAPASASASASAPSSSAAASTSASASTAASGADSNIPAGLTGTAKTVATNWVAFFDPATPTAKKLTLLQNGSKFSAVLAGEASNAQAKETAAQVTAVTVAGSTATVTWSLLLSGMPVIKGQKGQAILNNGVWQVADASFCGLLAMQPPVPGVCKA
jgi:hypothetical protein